MAKYSYAKVNFTEIDNTVRNTTTPSVGVGAIVMKANRGPVNERILTHNMQEFEQYFGKAENLDDYGHFAAENYFQNSNSMYAIRATMGDEAYAQIQYPYADAEAKDKLSSKDTASFQFIDNEDMNRLELLDPLEVATTMDESVQGEWDYNKIDNPFAASKKAGFVTVKDLIADTAEQVAIYKGTSSAGEGIDVNDIIKQEGEYVEFAKAVGKDGTIVTKEDDLIFLDDAYTVKGVALKDVVFGQKVAYVGPNIDGTAVSAYGVRTQFTVPAADTLNGSNLGVTCYLDEEYVTELKTTLAGDASASAKYSELLDDSKFYKGKYTNIADPVTFVEDAKAAAQIQFKDWDDCSTKTMYVEKASLEDTAGKAAAVAFREYGMADKAEVLVMSKDDNPYEVQFKKVSDMLQTAQDKALVTTIADEYGLELNDILGDTYGILSYVRVDAGKEKNPNPDKINDYYNGKREYKLIYADGFSFEDPSCYNEKLFYMYSKKGSEKTTTVSVYTTNGDPTAVVIPWQINSKGADDKGIDRLGAFATSEILNSPDGTYRDGYTRTMESDDEPGNGDVEQYVSNRDNQLIITSIGPGTYGNDIGVSIITAEAADIPALNHPNAFNWKYRFDDEDLVDKDDPNSDLTWKKVYRINVYAKTKTQTAETAWGTGLDALLKEPIEFFYVSNDPMAKDQEGHSLFAPNVINGNSDYIYVSRNSVNEAKTGAGTYAQPMQTFAIYGLTGGENSKKNLMTEKTAALKLYSDPQKADFDIIFNVEAIDTFNGKQRYAAFQKKLAQIAAQRTMDLGITQVTSMEAKNIKRMVSEGKNFSFQNGSYIVTAANYDKYYNSDLASFIYLPKSVAIACAEAYCQTIGKPWAAPAGTNRGQIAYATNQLVRLSDDEIGQLNANNINTSRLCGQYGECLWAQYTALKKESALNRINVRSCLNYIEKSLKNALDPFLFEQNIPTTRSSAKNIIDSFLSRVKAGGGIIDFDTSVIQDPSDEHIMLVNITMIPAEAIEYIDVRITINRGSLTYDESTRPIG